MENLQVRPRLIGTKLCGQSLSTSSVEKWKQLKLPMPDEEYVKTENKATHSKAFEMAGKSSKIQSDLDMNKIAENLEQGGFDLSDQLFKANGSIAEEAGRLAGMNTSLVSPTKPAGSRHAETN